MASLRKKLPAPDPVSDDLGPIAPTPDVAEVAASEPAAPSLAQFAEGGALTPDPSLKRQPEALRNSEELARQAAVVASVEQRRQAWVNQSELAQRHYAELANLHRDALASGYVDTSPQYFSYLNDRLATLQQHRTPELVEEIKELTAQDREPERPQPRRTPLVSAPVSRETSGGSYNGGYSSSRVQLTRQEAEMAKLAGISEAEYGRQKLKLAEYKKQRGEY